MKKFKVMDMIWSIKEEDGESFLHIEIPSEGEIEYDLDLTEALKLQKNLGQLIKVLQVA